MNGKSRVVPQKVGRMGPDELPEPDSTLEDISDELIAGRRYGDEEDGNLPVK